MYFQDARLLEKMEKTERLSDTNGLYSILDSMTEQALRTIAIAMKPLQTTEALDRLALEKD